MKGIVTKSYYLSSGMLISDDVISPAFQLIV